MNEPKQLSALLLAKQFLPREHPLAKRLLTDTFFRNEVETILRNCGLQLKENPYAEHISIALSIDQEALVFGQGDIWLNNNQNMPRDAVALLIVIWALIILPKRERQIGRQLAEEAEQNKASRSAAPLSNTERSRSASTPLSYRTLLSDFAHKLGKKVRVDANLKLLERFNFIERKGEDIFEGPLLDVLLDYEILAPRIINGALASLLTKQISDTKLAQASLPKETPADLAHSEV